MPRTALLPRPLRGTPQGRRQASDDAMGSKRYRRSPYRGEATPEKRTAGTITESAIMLSHSRRDHALGFASEHLLEDVPLLERGVILVGELVGDEGVGGGSKLGVPDADGEGGEVEPRGDLEDLVREDGGILSSGTARQRAPHEPHGEAAGEAAEPVGDVVRRVKERGQAALAVGGDGVRRREGGVDGGARRALEDDEHPYGRVDQCHLGAVHFGGLARLGEGFGRGEAEDPREERPAGDGLADREVRPREAVVGRRPADGAGEDRVGVVEPQQKPPADDAPAALREDVDEGRAGVDAEAAGRPERRRHGGVHLRAAARVIRERHQSPVRRPLVEGPEVAEHRAGRARARDHDRHPDKLLGPRGHVDQNCWQC
mmetsp:Transcript_16801/g.67794  ORF Transcript_16801/g.67794 Transcript_16801/m.67794 type:complete len:373 (-) Transcript_16801:364-1482(-)